MSAPIARYGPAVGAIRWPAYFPNRTQFISSFLGSPAGVTPTRIFTDFGNRAPSLWNNYSIWGTGVDTQSIVDAELQAAQGAVTYFAYDWYPPLSAFPTDPQNAPLQSGIMAAAEAHRVSPYKSLVSYTFMLTGQWWKYNTSLPGDWGRSSAYQAYMVACMQEAAYLKIGGRPVIGIYDYAALSGADQVIFQGVIDSLITAYGGPIYIDAQDFSALTCTDFLSRGARWKTTYGPNPGLPSPVNNTQYAWENQRARDVSLWGWPGGGIQYYSFLTPFNDQRPRNTLAYWVDQPSMPEWQNHIGAGFYVTFAGFGSATPEICVVYSWDEIDEGGPGMSPTVQERRRYLDALLWAKTGHWPSEYLYELDAAQNNFVKTGTWTRSAQTPGMFNNDEIISNSTSDKVDFVHTRCRYLGVLATMGPDRGNAEVLIDDVLVATVDLYAASTTYQNQVFMSTRLDGGTHKITVRVPGTKNPLSSSTQVGYDACRIIYNP
jgi:hypothetical protein